MFGGGQREISIGASRESSKGNGALVPRSRIAATICS
jgi:hypothetical protein